MTSTDFQPGIADPIPSRIHLLNYIQSLLLDLSKMAGQAGFPGLQSAITEASGEAHHAMDLIAAEQEEDYRLDSR